MKEFTTRLNKHCSAPPEVVYDIVADIRTHLAWGGVEQRSDFRLLSHDAPAGPAIVGTSFTSTGAIPMSLRKWSDSSTVTMAERPGTFEFVTHATVHRSRRSMEATYRHRYEIVAAPGGSQVSYTFTQLDASNPFLRLAPADLWLQHFQPARSLRPVRQAPAVPFDPRSRSVPAVLAYPWDLAARMDQPRPRYPM